MRRINATIPLFMIKISDSVWFNNSGKGAVLGRLQPQIFEFIKSEEKEVIAMFEVKRGLNCKAPEGRLTSALHGFKFCHRMSAPSLSFENFKNLIEIRF